jgi:hypothetical protein
MSGSLAAFRNQRGDELKKLAEEHLQHEHVNKTTELMPIANITQLEPVRPRPVEECWKQSLNIRRRRFFDRYRIGRLFRFQTTIYADGIL